MLVLMLYSWKCSFEVVFRDKPLPLFGDFLTLGGFVLQVTVFCLTEYKNKMQQTTTNCRLIWQIYL